MRRGADLTGFSGLGALLSGAADGFAMGQRISSQRNADKLAREREERYERERLAQEERQRQADERQRALDAVAGLLPADSVDQSERITLRDNSAVRGVVDAANRALASLAPGSGFTPMLAGPEDQTTERYRRVGDRVIDRSIADPEVKRIRTEEQERVERGNARRGLLALRGPDGASPLFRPEEVLGQDGDTLKAMKGEAALAPYRARQQAAQDAKAEAARAQTAQAAADVAVRQYGVSPDVALSAAQSGLLPTILKGIEDQRNDQRALNRGIVLARENDRPIHGRTPATPTGTTPPATLLRSSEDERKAAMHYALASEAANNLESAADPSLTGETLGGIPVVGNVLQNKIKPKQAILEQAGKQFVESYIFAITGQAAPESQMERLMTTVVPRAGDSEDVLARKRATRQVYLQGIRARAGNAYSNMVTQGIVSPDGKVQTGVFQNRPTATAEDEALGRAMYQNLIQAGVSKEEARKQVDEAFGGTP